MEGEDRREALCIREGVSNVRGMEGMKREGGMREV